MKLVVLRRKDGKPLFAFAEAISAWTAATGKDADELTDVWIGGKLFTVRMTLAELDAVLTDV